MCKRHLALILLSRLFLQTETGCSSRGVFLLPWTSVSAHLGFPQDCPSIPTTYKGGRADEIWLPVHIFQFLWSLWVDAHLPKGRDSWGLPTLLPVAREHPGQELLAWKTPCTCWQLIRTKKRSPGLGKISRWLFTIWEVTVRNWRGFWSHKCSESSERKRMWTECKERNGNQIERGRNLGFILDNQAVEWGITDVENCYHPKVGWLLLNGGYIKANLNGYCLVSGLFYCNFHYKIAIQGLGIFLIQDHIGEIDQ